MPPSALAGRVAYLCPNISHITVGGEAGLAKNLLPLQKSTPIYRILHHTLIKHREMMISIS